MMSDWFFATDAECVGFQARAVVGGVYAHALFVNLGLNEPAFELPVPA